MGQVNVMEVQDSERAMRMICDLLMKNQGFQIMINIPQNEGPQETAMESVRNKTTHDLEKDVFKSTVPWALLEAQWIVLLFNILLFLKCNLIEHLITYKV